MDQDDHQHEQEAGGKATPPARSDSAETAHAVSLQGEGNRVFLLSWLDASPDALPLVDAAGRIVLVNS